MEIPYSMARRLPPQPQSGCRTQLYTQLYIRLYRMPQSCPKQRLEGYTIPLSSVLGPIPQGLHKRFHSAKNLQNL